MTKNLTSDTTMKAFGDWLRSGDDTVRNLRKNAVKGLLRLYDADRVPELPDRTLKAIAEALGIPLSEKPKAKTDSVEQHRALLKAARQARLRKEEEADAFGTLWTVVGAYTSEKTFLMIARGRMSDRGFEAFRSQHQDAFMLLEPAALIGDVAEVRTQAVRQFAGKSTTDLMIRIVPERTFE